MYISHVNNKVGQDPALLLDRSINSSKFEIIGNLYSEADLNFIKQLRRLRNSIVHFNGVYSKTNPINYTFNNKIYCSDGHEGENIQILLCTSIVKSLGLFQI